MKPSPMYFSHLFVTIFLFILLSSLTMKTVLAYEIHTGSAETVTKYHPLCLDRLYPEDPDKAPVPVDVTACNREFKSTPYKNMTAERPRVDDTYYGFIGYTPLGVFDDILDILLVHDNGGGSGTFTSVYIIGREPHKQEKNHEIRLFVGELQPGGDRCNRGIKEARLSTPGLLEVDISVTPFGLINYNDDTNWRFAWQRHKLLGQPMPEPRYMIMPYTGLENSATSCIGTITRQFNLLNGSSRYIYADINAFDATNASSYTATSQNCFNRVFFETHPQARTLEMDELNQLIDEVGRQCSGSIVLQPTNRPL